MPAGDLLTGANYEHEIRSYLIGDVWCVDNVKGWVGHSVKSNDQERTLRDGAISGPDYRAARVIVLELYLHEAEGDEDAVFEAIDDLETAWAESTTDIELHATLPYKGHVYVSGRPRDLVIDDLRESPHGRVEAQAFFYCPTPTVTVAVP